MAVEDVAGDEEDGWKRVKKLVRRNDQKRRVERHSTADQVSVQRHHRVTEGIAEVSHSRDPRSGHRDATPSSTPGTVNCSKGSTIHIPPFALISPKFVSQLKTFQTEGCLSLRLETDRLTLRQVELSDLPNIQKIKTEPMVQKTQLYGSPTADECRNVFLNKYIRSSMPRVSVMGGSKCRDDYIFAITLKDPASVSLKPAAGLRLSSMLTSLDGYLGNIGMSLETRGASSSLLPQSGIIYRHPTFAQCSKGKLIANMYYELHPQVWGLGLMSEAFGAVLRFAMQDVGCETVICNPTTSNVASIKSCERYGLVYSHADTKNEYRKPQAFYKISRKTWWSKNRPNEVVESPWAKKVVCRWCMSFHFDEPAFKCDGCNWARYCTVECRRADWNRTGGHQSECK